MTFIVICYSYISKKLNICQSYLIYLFLFNLYISQAPKETVFFHLTFVGNMFSQNSKNLQKPIYKVLYGLG